MTIWPARLPKSIRQKRRRRSEVRVYDKLAAELEEDFTVFYSSPWLGTDHHGNEKDGECDFLIAHPVLGVLALEVKGGGIEYVPEEMQWWSTDEDGIRHNIKDPVEQARSAKHNIVQKLKDSRRWRSKWIFEAHGVIFPGAARVPRDLGADRPPQIFCCANQFNSGLREWIGQRFAEGKQPKNVEPLGRDGIEALEHILAQPFTLNFSISAAVGESREQLATLEPAQFQILEHIAELPRVLVRGGAGTGKTVVAIEAARRGALYGTKTLLCCHSNPLAADLREKSNSTEFLTVSSFHSMCSTIAREAGIEIPTNDGTASYFSSTLPDLLINAMAVRPDLRWEYIVVDEAQDFEEDWWMAIEAALAPDGRLMIFADSNQQVYGNRRIPLIDLQLSPIRLTRNLRNTRNIHDAAAVHYSGHEIFPDGPAGVAVNWIADEDSERCIEAAYKELRRLVYQEEIPMDDIAVILPDKTLLEKFRIQAATSSFEFSSADQLASANVILDTIRRFKGLERPVIICLLEGNDDAASEMAYVAISRARYFLTVVASRNLLPILQTRRQALK